jgi:cytoskeletal protein RodZ
MARKIFETKKINMETLPEYLKAARESFSYDLKQVSKITNISDKFLRSLEEGHYHRLPADVYVYGFLKKLSELYRVDADLLLSQYKTERNIHENLNQSKTSTKNTNIYRPSVPSKFAFTPRTITVGLLALLILFVIGYVVYQVQAINRPPAINILEPADGSIIHASSVLLRGQTDVGASLYMDGQQLSVDSSGNFKEPISVSNGPKVLTLVATNSFGKKNTKQLSIIGDLPDTSTANTSAQQNTFSLTLIIGPNQALVTVAVDGQSSAEQNLTPGTSKTYTASQKIVISTSDAGSTSIQINGGQKILLGKDGQQLTDLTFTAANAAGSK